MDEYGLTLILKKVVPTPPSDLRPIAVLPCLSKLFFATWTHIITPTVTPLSKYQFAFREKHQAAEYVFCIENAYWEIR